MPAQFTSRLKRVLVSPWMAPAAAVLAVALASPAIHNGLIADDYLLRAAATGSERYGEWLPASQDMARPIPDDPERIRSLMEAGILPWWTVPEIKAEFFHPVFVQTILLDYQLWPGQPALMHVHSLIWFGALVFLAARFYRRILGATWMAGLAALLFAIEDTHGIAAGVVFMRNGLMAACFGFGCLIAHDAWRREGRRGAAWLAVALLVLSLGSKEAGIATSAYLFAYALWLDRSSLRSRFRSLVPCGIVLVAWAIARGLLGCGVENAGFYVDPVADPGRFALALVERFPVLILGQLGVPADFQMIAEVIGRPHWWPALGITGLMALLAWPVLRRDRLAVFFVTGALLAAIPICATFPSDRLLLFVGLGFFGFLVRFWHAVFAADGLRPKFGPWRVAAMPVAMVLILVHLVVAPALLPTRAKTYRLFEPLYLDVPDDEPIAGQDLIVVNAPMTFFTMHGLLENDHRGLPTPRALRALTSGLAPVRVTREDNRTLVVEPGLPYLSLFDSLFRDPEQHPLAAGDRVRLARFTATVLEAHEGRPLRVAFRFETPLEDPSLRWLRFRAGQWESWTPPRVGEGDYLETEWEPEFRW